MIVMLLFVSMSLRPTIWSVSKMWTQIDHDVYHSIYLINTNKLYVIALILRETVAHLPRFSRARSGPLPFSCDNICTGHVVSVPVAIVLRMLNGNYTRHCIYAIIAIIPWKHYTVVQRIRRRKPSRKHGVRSISNFNKCPYRLPCLFWKRWFGR